MQKLKIIFNISKSLEMKTLIITGEKRKNIISIANFKYKFTRKVYLQFQSVVLVVILAQ